MEYRLGTTYDIDDVFSLLSDAIAEMEKHGIYQWDEIYPARSDLKKDIQDKNLYVVFDEDMLIAFYVISGECDEQYGNAEWKYDDSSAYILHRFCVSPKVQKQGVGKAVLQYVENQIKEMGYESVRLDAFTKNPFAQKLYRHNGYETRGYADWRKGRFDLMEKHLSDESSFIWTDGSNEDFQRFYLETEEYYSQIVGGKDKRSAFVPFNLSQNITDVLIAYDGEKAVGCAGLKRYSDTDVELKRVWVDPECRGRHIASKMLDKIEEKSRDMGFSRIILQTRPLMEDAVRLYEKRGYKIISNYPPYDKLDGAICMARDL